jgi:hypothetical protein
MQYMLLIHSKEGGWAKMSKVEQEQGLAAHMAYGQALKVAGAYVGRISCAIPPPLHSSR